MTNQEDANLQLSVRRLGIVMEPEPGNPVETGGVLNPGAAGAELALASPG